MGMPWDIILGPIFKIIDKIVPDVNERERQKLVILEMHQRGELAWLDADLKLAMGQMEVNKVEAASPGIFKGGWRPAAGWGCVLIGIFYPFLRVVLPWALTVAGVVGVPELPPLDTGEQLAMLSGLLGLGGMRMNERIKNKA